jgi:hypothetical protein
VRRPPDGKQHPQHRDRDHHGGDHGPQAAASTSHDQKSDTTARGATVRLIRSSSIGAEPSGWLPGRRGSREPDNEKLRKTVRQSRARCPMILADPRELDRQRRARAGRASSTRSPVAGAPAVPRSGAAGAPAVPRSGAALILIHGQIRQWGRVWGLPNALLRSRRSCRPSP